MNAIRVAKKSVDGDLVEKLGCALTHLDEVGESFNEALFDRIGKRFEKKKGVIK
jgi:hypothetical protein